MRNVIFILIGIVALSSCTQHPYLEMEERELSSGVRYDSLFLGIKFGMKNEEFFAQCWELNKQQLVKQGPGSGSVEYIISEGVSSPIRLLFVPGFHDGQVYQMDMKFDYINWAPWNKKLTSDQLIVEITDLMRDWYGEGFVEIKNKDNNVAYAKVNGNRRVSIFKYNESTVSVLLTDLTVSKNIEESK